MRYALIWYYGADIRDSRTTAREYIRNGMSIVLRLQHEGKLDNEHLDRELGLCEVSSHYGLHAMVWAALIRYAASVKDRRVLAYNLPITTEVDGYTYVGVVDGVTVRGNTLRVSKYLSTPSSAEPHVDDFVLGLTLSAFPRDILDTAREDRMNVEWTSVRARGSRLIEDPVHDVPDPFPVLRGVIRGINNRVFYPRWSRALCRRCGAAPVCRTSWLSEQCLSRRKRTRSRINKELSNAVRTQPKQPRT